MKAANDEVRVVDMVQVNNDCSLRYVNNVQIDGAGEGGKCTAYNWRFGNDWVGSELILLKAYEYVRAGSANVLFVVEPKAWRYIIKDRSPDCYESSIFLTELANGYSSADKIALVMDNLSTHSLEVLKQHIDETPAQKTWRGLKFSSRPNTRVA